MSLHISQHHSPNPPPNAARHGAPRAEQLDCRPDRFCILGAGSSGLAVARHFQQQRIAFDCLEREDEVGGNWYYGKPHSSVYQSVRLISSKRGTEYGDFPMPDDYPEHPGHEQVWQYLRSYARRFDLYGAIEFNTSVSRIEPAPAGQGSGWDVVLAGGARRRYRGVVIASGHNWDPRWPSYPGCFDGEVLHAADYKTPEPFRGRQVLVVGGGNSGFDIAVDVAREAATTFHSLRRGYRILPRFLGDTPIDQCGLWMLRWRLPLWVRRLAAARAQRLAWGALGDVLPRPDHRLFETHPVINSDWPGAVSSGAIHPKPDVAELRGGAAAFVDGSREPLDAIIYATGYKLSFPFVDRAHLNWRGERPELYLNIFHPQRDDLFVAGLIQPNSGQFGLVDQQAQLIASYVCGLDKGQAAARRFQRRKGGAGASLHGGIRYVGSPRHVIEVEHYSYRRELRRWTGRLRR